MWDDQIRKSVRQIISEEHEDWEFNIVIPHDVDYKYPPEAETILKRIGKEIESKYDVHQYVL
ncbi:MAG: hypothetical protein ACMUHM_07835, partial [Thermoplasmatota archaeon]